VLPVEWKAAARADLLEILDFISERNEQAAQHLFERIEHDLEHAAEHPYLYKPSLRLPGLREIVTHPNYVVFYRVTTSCIEVVNVIHSRRKLPASPPHAGHRCGTTVVRRRRGRVWRVSRIGIWQTNHRPTTSTISALPGEFVELGDGGNGPAGVRLCPQPSFSCRLRRRAANLGN